MPTSHTTHTTQHQRTTQQQHRANNSTRGSSQSRSSYQTRFTESTKPVSELFEQAMSSYEQAFRTGLKLQEESSKWFTSMLEQAGPSRDWQKTFRTVANEMMPEVQKRMEDGLRMVEQNSRASLEVLRLFKKAVEMPNSNPIAETQTKLLSFWEASLNSVRDSAQAVAQANTQAVESWMELFRKGTEMAAERVRV